MTIVLFQIFSRTEIRVWHLVSHLISTVNVWLLHWAATYSILGNIPLEFHWLAVDSVKVSVTIPIFVPMPLEFFGLLTGSHRPVFWGAPRGEHLSIRVRSYHDQLHGPSASRNTFFSVHDHGRQRWERGPQPLTCPYVGLTVHWAVSVRRSTTGRRPSRQRPGAVFEEDPHARSDAGRPLEPWVCRHTWEPTVLSRLSCRPSHLNVDFHQPCLLPWRVPYCHRNTAGLGRDRWGLSVSPYPRLSLLCDSLEVLPRRQDGTTAGC